MSGEQDSEKSEEATQARRDDFRKKGQVAQTRELGTAMVLIMSSMLIYAFSKGFLREMFDLFHLVFGQQIVGAARHEDMLTTAITAGKSFALLTFPFLGVCVIVGLGSSLIQTGLLQIEDALSAKMERIDPMQGFKRIFSMRSVVEGIKSFIKMVLIAGVAYLILKSEAAKIPFLSQYNVQDLFGFMALMAAKLMAVIGLCMLIVAGADYFFAWWDLEKRMMMTKQEVKEEHKSREGDPMIKARIRRIQREVANRRMMEKVPEADVIITNPTHIAVALKYGANLPAPLLLAKGGDLVAARIKEIAALHNIPIVENKPLARTIFKTMKIGQVIPRELYVAVAEVLSYVFKLKRRMQARGRH